MFGYYTSQALHTLARNVSVTILMVFLIGVGIGASMTTLTIFLAMSGDPIPQKSAQLFAPQIDICGVSCSRGPASSPDRMPDQLTYADAVALMRLHAATRQAAMYATWAMVMPLNQKIQQFGAPIRATYADFFSMFDRPFTYGTSWSGNDDDAHTPVAVITAKISDRIFGGGNSVGKVLRIGNRDYRVVGVTSDWTPLPKFYDLSIGYFGGPDQIFIPFTRAVDDKLGGDTLRCLPGADASGREGILRSECIWIEFWAELPDVGAVRRYRALIASYAADQRRSGRFSWLPRVQLRDVREWLPYHHVVSSQVQLLLAVSFSFLLVCILNVSGLMLARNMARSAEVGVRRALGASRRAIFAQYLTEAAVLGLCGAIPGLALTWMGLAGCRALLSRSIVLLMNLQSGDVIISVLLAIGVTILAGLWPTWRAAHAQPALQLKSQ
jgi:putative ABC transport system permease protein